MLYFSTWFLLLFVACYGAQKRGQPFTCTRRNPLETQIQFIIRAERLLFPIYVAMWISREVPRTLTVARTAGVPSANCRFPDSCRMTSRQPGSTSIPSVSLLVTSELEGVGGQRRLVSQVWVLSRDQTDNLLARTVHASPGWQKLIRTNPAGELWRQYCTW